MRLPRIVPSLLLVLACSPAAEPVDLVAMCNEAGECIVDGCLDLRDELDVVAGEMPECLGSCIDCTECEALPETQAWRVKVQAARDAWASCVEVCTDPFAVEELDVEKWHPRCVDGGEDSEYCAIGAAYNATRGADDPDVMGVCSDVVG